MDSLPSHTAHPSSVLKRQWRSHKREQTLLRKQKLPTCQFCSLCASNCVQQLLHTQFFEGVVDIYPHSLALNASAQSFLLTRWTYTATQRIPIENYWTSGVGPKGAPSGCAVGVIRYSPGEDSWITQSSGFRGNISSTAPSLEMLGVYAIAHALKIALRDYLATREDMRPRRIRIYSDDVLALRMWAGFRYSLAELRDNPKIAAGQILILESLVACEELVTFGYVRLELRYVPREGNVKANKVARNGATLGLEINIIDEFLVF